MPTKIYAIERRARKRLEELTPRFWSSDELTEIIVDGIKDLWRDVVDLKQEHFLTINEDDVTLAADTSTLSGIPEDIHKVYLIEPLDGTTNYGLVFEPLDYNDGRFRAARTFESTDPQDTIIYYSVSGAGSTVGAPTIHIAPQVKSEVSLRFCYIPTVSSSLTGSSDVPIPGDCDNALVAWTVAYARAKEREDRAPDPGWLAIYERQKALLVKSLGVRNLQEPVLVDAIFQEYT